MSKKTKPKKEKPAKPKQPPVSTQDEGTPKDPGKP